MEMSTDYTVTILGSRAMFYHDSWISLQTDCHCIRWFCLPYAFMCTVCSHAIAICADMNTDIKHQIFGP